MITANRPLRPKRVESRMRRPIDRPGFTLIELLVVITIILIVSAVALPTVLPALQHRQVSEAARILQAALSGARDAAIRDNAPNGIRLLPDPNLNGIGLQYLADGVTPNPYYTILDPKQPLAYNRIVPIEQAPEYMEGFAEILNPTVNPASGVGAIFTSAGGLNYPVPSTVGGSTTGLVYPYSTLASVGNVLMVVEVQFGSSGPNPPTSWFWNVRVGDKIQFNNAGPWYTVVGPMAIAPINPSTPGQNPDLFVNVGMPGTSAMSLTQNGVAATPEFLFLVNGKDDNGNGWVDEGWDGVDNNNNSLVDELLEWETETWSGALAGQLSASSPTQMTYTIQRRPIPTTNARETSLPSQVVVDASTLYASMISSVLPERTRVPGPAFNQCTGAIDVMINPDGSVLPTTIYSSPSSVGMTGAFYHFWLAERQDVMGQLPIMTQSPYLPVGVIPPQLLAGGTYSGPLLQGEYRIVTLFARSGQITTNDNVPFDNPQNPANGATYNVSYPFLAAQQGIAGGQQ